MTTLYKRVKSDHLSALTVIVKTEVRIRDRHSAVPRQPLAQVGVGDTREDLHVVVRDGVGHLDLAEKYLSRVTRLLVKF